jgi:hypothetical protein
MRWGEWNTTLVTEDSSLVGPVTLEWACENSKDDIEEKVETTLREEKVYPEEDFKYEGDINGKKVEGRFVTGHGPLKSVRAVREGESLSDAERAAGISHIDWFC